MESTKDRFAYLQFFIELGPQNREEAQEKETYEEAFHRLWSDFGSLTENEFQARLAQLSDLADAQTEVAACCDNGTCDLCSWLDWLNTSQDGAAALDYERPGEFVPPFGSLPRSGYGHSFTQ